MCLTLESDAKRKDLFVNLVSFSAHRGDVDRTPTQVSGAPGVTRLSLPTCRHGSESSPHETGLDTPVLQLFNRGELLYYFQTSTATFYTEIGPQDIIPRLTCTLMVEESGKSGQDSTHSKREILGPEVGSEGEAGYRKNL